ncbi:hypothetical protein T484DRAFT_1774918 [Baffinella frigidus]|nr:hypothetical protein T484DRAFT_1774918 [Cryptophyta sp. CCMP2293]
MWSLGVIVYILLSGIPPFFKFNESETLHHVRERIIKGAYRFYSPYFDNVSEAARDFISCLVVALEHRWITGLAPDTGLGGEYMVELSSFNDRRDSSLSLSPSPRGMYKMASHALAGLERSIQPLVSLAYSKAADDWKNACNAMANLALKEEFQFKIVQEEFQFKIVQEGGLRRLNQLASKAKASDVKFFVALAIARIAHNPHLRTQLVV